MRVTVFCSDVEWEWAWILDDLVAQFDEDRSPFLVSLLQQDRVQGGVELLADVL